MDASNKYVLNSHGYELLGNGRNYYCYAVAPPAGNMGKYAAFWKRDYQRIHVVILIALQSVTEVMTV